MCVCGWGSGGGGGGGGEGVLEWFGIATTILQSRKLQEFEQLWARVKRGVANGSLGPVAKFPARGSVKNAVILVYTRSFLDVDDVWRVYDALCHISASPVSWKADMMVQTTQT